MNINEILKEKEKECRQEKGIFYIQKPDKPKDAIRINSKNDIPEELAKNFEIFNDGFRTLTAEGWSPDKQSKKLLPFGWVVGIDRVAPTETGFGVFQLDPSTYIEKDGVFWPAKNVKKACFSFEDSSLKDELIEKGLINGDILKATWGEQKMTKRSLIVSSDNGDIYVLTQGTTSFDENMVCDKNGKNISTLNQFFDNHFSEKEF